MALSGSTKVTTTSTGLKTNRMSARRNARPSGDFLGAGGRWAWPVGALMGYERNHRKNPSFYQILAIGRRSKLGRPTWEHIG